MPAISGIYDYLIATPAITAKLNTYQLGTGAAKSPSIFTSFEEPADALGPYIRLSVPSSAGGVNSEDRGHIGGLSIVDVVVYDEKSRSSKKLRETAQLIWETLHRARPTDENYEMFILATPPAQLPDPEGFPGYVVSCEVTIRELKGDES
jgi:hypothetical protein